MPHYQAPLADFRFLLQEVFDYEARVASLPGLGDATMDLVMPVLDSAGEFVRELLLPLNLPGDTQGCTLDAQGVHTPGGYRAAYEAYCAGGWPSLSADPAHGGQGLPLSLALFVRELVAAGSMAFGMYGGLSQGACRALSAHGSETLRKAFLPHLVSGRWTGTMCMTEPECGSDLSRLRTRAVPAADGSYRVTGNKIFISGGDHDLAENIVHLVLARLPDAPPGTRGISLFVVPRHLPPVPGAVLDRGVGNGVACTAIEHKMGIRGSATTSLSFEDATGWLVGEPHGGLKAMFTMMNSSRMGVAVQSVGVAEISWQNARHYANERRQGRAPVPEGGAAAGDAIVLHPDVRRQLLTMKALVEGSRALYVDAAIALDVRARHPDATTRQQAEQRLALMTPVLKSFISDSAVQVADLGISVFGGHGYIHDNGAEQWLRDARIVPLYEGTNAIQALDLVHRKLGLDEGRAVLAFFDELAPTAAHRSEDALAELCAPLDASLAELRAATTLLQAADATTAAAAASDYLRLFGWVMLGAAWLRMAVAAQRGSGGEAPAFYQGKLKTARFVMSRLMPETQRLSHCIQAGSEGIVSISAEEL